MRLVFILLAVLIAAFSAAWIWMFARLEPAALKPGIETYFQQHGVQARVGYLSLKPGLRPRLILDGLILRDLESGGLLFKMERCEATVSLPGLWRGRWKMKALEISGPELYLQKGSKTLKNGLLEALKPREASEAGGGGRGGAQPLVEGFPAKITARGGTLFYRDLSRSTPFEFRLHDLLLVLGTGGQKYAFQIRSKLGSETGLENVFSGVYDPGEDRLQFRLDFENAQFEALGSLKNPFTDPQFSGTVELRHAALNRLPGLTETAGIQGYVTGSMEGRFEGLHPERIRDSMRMQGSLEIREGRVENRNIVHELLNTMSSMPGIALMLLEDMPAEAAEVLRGPATQFDALSANFEIRDGLFKAVEMNLKDRDYLITGSGQVDLRSFESDFQLRLVMLETLSDFLKQKIYEFHKITNSRGRIVIPFRYEGSSERGHFMFSSPLNPSLEAPA